MRPGFLVTGTVLWIAVGVSLFAMWSTDAPSDSDSGEAPGTPQSGVGDPIIVKPGSDPGDESEEPVVGPVEVKLTWSEEGTDDFAFTDSGGETVSKNDLLGAPWVASFIFTRCAGPCPKVAAAVKTLQQRYEGKDVKFVTFTVDPKNDTPEVLAQFAAFWEADPERWFFLTGDRDEIYHLITTSFLMTVMEDPNPTPGYEIIHTTNVCLVDPTGRVVGKYNSTSEEEVAVLRRDLDAMFEQPTAGVEGPSGDSE